MSWKVVVDYDVCESNAICMGIAPEVFEVRDDDFLYLLQDEPPDELREKVESPCGSAPSRPSPSSTSRCHRLTERGAESSMGTAPIRRTRRAPSSSV